MVTTESSRRFSKIPANSKINWIETSLLVETCLSTNSYAWVQLIVIQVPGCTLCFVIQGEAPARSWRITCTRCRRSCPPTYRWSPECIIAGGKDPSFVFWLWYFRSNALILDSSVCGSLTPACQDTFHTSLASGQAGLPAVYFESF